MKNLIIFDFNGTLLKRNTSLLKEGSLELLKKFAASYTLVLVSLDQPGRQEIARLLTSEFFDEMYFVKEKTKKTFRKIIDKHSTSASQCFIIGDTENQEISIGKDIGCKTIFIDELKQSSIADFSVSNLAEVTTLIGE